MKKVVDYFIDTGFTDIEFVNVGEEICSPGHFYGPLEQISHLVHIVFDGKGSVWINHKQYELKKGDYFYFRPGDVTYYEADAKDPWHYFWFGFQLGESFSYLEEMIHEVGCVQELENIIPKSKVLTEIDFGSKENSLWIQSEMLSLLALFMESIKVQSASYQGKFNDKNYTELFCREVRLNYWQDDLTVKKIADKLGLSPSYFISIINKEMNQSPGQYLMHYRLEKGLQYLKYSNQTVAEISFRVGYRNVNNFSRSFKKRYGLSPYNYRKKIGGLL